MMNGERLKRMRIAKGLSQKDVAKLLDIDRTTYLKYENGSSNPNLARLIQLANYFNTTPDYLLSEAVTASENAESIITVKPAVKNDCEKLISLYHSLDDQSKKLLMSVAYLLEASNLASKDIDISQIVESQLHKIYNKKSKENEV